MTFKPGDVVMASTLFNKVPRLLTLLSYKGEGYFVAVDGLETCITRNSWVKWLIRRDGSLYSEEVDLETIAYDVSAAKADPNECSDETLARACAGEALINGISFFVTNLE